MPLKIFLLVFCIFISCDKEDRNLKSDLDGSSCQQKITEELNLFSPDESAFVSPRIEAKNLEVGDFSVLKNIYSYEQDSIIRYSYKMLLDPSYSHPGNFYYRYYICPYGVTLKEDIISCSESQKKECLCGRSNQEYFFLTDLEKFEKTTVYVKVKKCVDSENSISRQEECGPFSKTEDIIVEKSVGTMESKKIYLIL